MRFGRPRVFPVSFWIGVSLLSAASVSAQLANYTAPKVEYSDEVYWKGPVPCGQIFETPVPRLPGGSSLTQILGEESVQARYELSGGGALRITTLQPIKIPVEGDTYLKAKADLWARKPFQDSISRKTSQSVVMADVDSRFRMSARPYELAGDAGFALKPKSLTLFLTAKVRVAEWPGYLDAAQNDQRKWAGHLCENSHHELGHILVAAQVLEESESEWLNIRAGTTDELDEKIAELLSEIGVRIRARQAAYHAEIAAMGLPLSHSRPYLELPFSWLGPDNQGEALTP